MKLTQNFKRILSAMLVLVLIFSLMPVTALAADTSRKNDTIFFATDYHQIPTRLSDLLEALAYQPGLVVLGGDYVNNEASFSFVDITDTIQSVYPGVQTFYTYGVNDANGREDGSNRFAFARTGEYITGEDYYVYAVDYTDMTTVESAAAASSQFLAWAGNADPTKVIFVMCHMPLHKMFGENAGAATWMNALNQIGESHDLVFLWGYDHNSSSPVSNFIAKGSTLTPAGGTAGTINFTYVNAGYIQKGNGTMVMINDENVTFVRYSAIGNVVSTNSMDRTIIAHKHDWKLTDTVDATCAKNGSNTYACTTCTETYTEVIYATGQHNRVTTTVDPTCTDKGSSTTTCTTCGDSYTMEIDALGHDYEFQYNTGGTIDWYRCTVCKNWWNDNLGVQDEHEYYVTKTDEPTCTEEGLAYYACAKEGCTETKTEVLPALGHTYKTVTDRPTCAKDGTETYTCIICDYSESITLPAQEHVYQTVTNAPTCTETGLKITTCANCAYYNEEVLPATGHTEEVVTTAAYCARNGAIVTTCSTCGESDTEVIPATGHTYELTTVEATCTSIGYTTHTCTTCGSYYNSNKVAALGHNYTEEVIAPTCTTAGFTRSTCSTCGEITISNNVAALGHSYTGDVSENHVVYTCSTCKDSYTEEIAGNYTYAKTTQFTTAGEFVITLYSNKNYYALSHKDNQITAVPVTVVNNEITSEVTEDLLWKHSSKKLYYKDENGQTHYLTASGSTLGIGTSGPASISYSGSKLKVGTRYLRFSNNVVSLSTSSTTTYLYKQAE